MLLDQYLTAKRSKSKTAIAARNSLLQHLYYARKVPFDSLVKALRIKRVTLKAVLKDKAL